MVSEVSRAGCFFLGRLSEAQNIILFGSGAGCAAMMAVISGRGESLERTNPCAVVVRFMDSHLSSIL